jgi:hypothetical protein
MTDKRKRRLFKGDVSVKAEKGSGYEIRSGTLF